jgi:hypothetical protein
VCWAGRDASGDLWEPLELLTNCETALVTFRQATGRALPCTASARVHRSCSRAAAATAADRVHHRRGAAGRPGGGTRGPAGALLVAERWLSARHRCTPPSLHARRVAARGGLHPAESGRRRRGLSADDAAAFSYANGDDARLGWARMPGQCCCPQSETRSPPPRAGSRRHRQPRRHRPAGGGPPGLGPGPRPAHPDL